jgi:hypothetical protein
VSFFRPPWRPNRSQNAQYPMGLQNGKVVGAWQQNLYAQRAPFAEDYDFTQRQFRRYVDASGAQSVQLPSGLDSNRFRGYRYGYRGAGWYFAMVPRIPGQTRGNYGGFVPHPPSAQQLQTIVQQTAGQQPTNPAGFYGPGGIAGDTFFNPMTG